MMKWVSILLVCLSSFSAFAEEELLNILDTATTAKPKAAATKKVVVPPSTQMRAYQQMIGSSSGDVNVFLNQFFAGDIKGALFSFDGSMPSAFKNSATGKAFYAYLLFANGLRLEGLERVLATGTPDQVKPTILELWKPLVTKETKEWRIGKLTASPSWAEFFGLTSQAAQVATWKEATQIAVNGKPEKAAKMLAGLLNETDPYVSKELIYITAARLLYQQGFLDAAIRYDNQVTKGSDYWFEAQEEAAWAEMRKGQVGKALAITTSLQHPTLKQEVGPESVFLHSLVNLKVCNYPEVITTLKTYKERFRPRVIALQKLTTESESKAIAGLLNQAAKEELTPVKVGYLSAEVPRAAGFDRALRHDGFLYGLVRNEAKVAGDLFALSLQKGSQVGFQGKFEQLKQKIQSREQSLKSTFTGRVKELARAEVKEISVLLQKMHIVEAEVIQQTGLANRIVAASQKAGQDKDKSKAKVSVASDEVVFDGDGEVWFDELTHYKMDVKKGCQSKTL